MSKAANYCAIPISNNILCKTKIQTRNVTNSLRHKVILRKKPMELNRLLTSLNYLSIGRPNLQIMLVLNFVTTNQKAMVCGN